MNSTLKNNFYYALGAIKNVGYAAISNLVKERTKNGKFTSLFDFINRTDPKDINKLQLEGLVKAGAFDSFNNNRRSIFESIPNLILKSKNLYENKSLNQINLFDENTEQSDKELLFQTNDFQFDERLSILVSSLLKKENTKDNNTTNIIINTKYFIYLSPFDQFRTSLNISRA